MAPFYFSSPVVAHEATIDLDPVKGKELKQCE